jgi:hypothetical protein
VVRFGFSTIAEILRLTVVWRWVVLSIIIKVTYGEMPWILLLRGVQIWWTSLTGLSIGAPHARAILGSQICTLLVYKACFLGKQTQTTTSTATSEVWSQRPSKIIVIIVRHSLQESRECYGQLAIVSNVDGCGVCPECRQRNEVLPCYIEASTTEQCWDRGGQDAHKVDECTE